MKRSRSMLLLALGGASLAAYCVLILLPGQRSITMIRRQLDERRQFINEVNQQAAASEGLAQQLEVVAGRVETWHRSAPQAPNLVDVLGKLAYLARESGVKLNRLNPQPPIRMQSLKQHPLVLELEGDFDRLVEFLARVEELPETIWTRQLELRPKGEAGSTAQCELLLTVFADNPDISG